MTKAIVEIGSKFCTKCGTVKPVTAFAFCASKKDGLQSKCRDCSRKYQLADTKRRERNRQSYERQKQRIVSGVTEATCTSCGVTKPASMFSINRAAPNGLVAKCRTCKKEYDAKHRTANRERKKAVAAAYREQNGDRLSLWFKDHYRKHIDEKKAASREYRRANPEKVAAALRRWHERHPGYSSVRTAIRRARKLQLPSDFTRADREAGFSYWNRCCAVCDQAFDLIHKCHWDHWIPLASSECLGTVPGNMVPLCEYCNLTKNDRTPCEWLVWRVGKDAASAQHRIDTYFAQCREVK